MSKSAYPTSLELEGYLSSLGVLNPDRYDAAFTAMRTPEKALAAQAAWEERVGWNPYLSTGTVTARYFDPPGPNRGGLRRGGGTRLDLGSALQSVTEVCVGYDPRTQSGGTVLTANLDFFTLDWAGNYDGDCIEVIEFTYPQWGWPKSLKVRGPWGRVAALDEEVWEIVRQYGAYLCYQELSNNISHGFYRYQEQNVRIQYGSAAGMPLHEAAATWQKQFLRLAERRMREEL